MSARQITSDQIPEFKNLFFEILSEEIPAKLQRDAASNMKAFVEQWANDHNITYNAHYYPAQYLIYTHPKAYESKLRFHLKPIIISPDTSDEVINCLTNIPYVAFIFRAPNESIHEFKLNMETPRSGDLLLLVLFNHTIWDSLEQAS